MSMNFVNAALIDTDDLVVAVVVLADDGDWEPPDGLAVHVLAEGSRVGPGWTLTGDEFNEPAYESPPPAPPTVLDLQAQLDDLADFIANTL